MQVFDGVSKWGHICGTYWDYKNSEIVCRYMGFSSAVGYSSVARENAEFFINKVVCSTKNDTSLEQCLFTGWTNVNRHCAINEVVAVECSGKQSKG